VNLNRVVRVVVCVDVWIGVVMEMLVRDGVLRLGSIIMKSQFWK